MEKPLGTQHIVVLGCGAGVASNGQVFVRLNYAKTENEERAVREGRRKPRSMTFMLTEADAITMGMSLVDAAKRPKL